MKKYLQKGQTFGRLTIEGFSHKTCHRGSKVKYRYYYRCVCSCGKSVIVGEDNLKQGKTQSCGCLHNELLAKRNERHSLSKTRIYYIFNGMKDRCYNNKNKSYKDYGGRGITICDEWLNDFVVFYKWATENGYKEGLSIERIDVNKGYSPENCAWIPKEMQAKNTRKNVFYEYKGEKKILGDWAKQYNLPFTCVRRRLNRGWTLERALNTPNMRNQI